MSDKKMKILLVEDDVFMRKIYSEAFALEGLDLITAENGEEGLLQVYKNPPDLILLDIMMPELNGLEVLEKLKFDPVTRPIPVIMLTNLSGKIEASTALSKGALQYLVKSEYDPKQVISIVKKALESSKT
jgi:CheY-like chemotaxis protein